MVSHSTAAVLEDSIVFWEGRLGGAPAEIVAATAQAFFSASASTTRKGSKQRSTS